MWYENNKEFSDFVSFLEEYELLSKEEIKSLKTDFNIYTKAKNILSSYNEAYILYQSELNDLSDNEEALLRDWQPLSDEELSQIKYFIGR